MFIFIHLFLVSTVQATLFKGFCYYNIANGSRSEDQYKSEYIEAQNFPGTSGWNTAELYTPLGLNNTGISPAVTAAIATGTKLLIAVCAQPVNNVCDPSVELNAMQSLASQYGSNFTDLLVGIMILDYSISGERNHAGYVASMISQARTLVAGTPLRSIPLGYRDFPEVWLDPSMSQVIAVSDFVFARIYPMSYNTTKDVLSGVKYAEDNLRAIQNVSGSTPVWVSTGWPNTISADARSFALTPSVTDAKTYWDMFGCGVLFNTTSTLWGTVEPTDFGDDMLDSAGNLVHALSCPQGDNAGASSTTSPSGSTSTGLAQGNTSSSNSGSSSPTNLALILGLALGLGLPLLFALIGLLLWRLGCLGRMRSKRQQPATGHRLDDLYKPRGASGRAAGSKRTISTRGANTEGIISPSESGDEMSS